MKIRTAVLASTLAIVGATLLPLNQAAAHDLNVRVSTPEFGVRFGTPRPFIPPVAIPPVVIAPVRVAPPVPVVYEREPRVIYGPPRVIYVERDRHHHHHHHGYYEGRRWDRDHDGYRDRDHDGRRDRDDEPRFHY